MKSLNFDAIEAKQEGGAYKQLPAGAYTCVITDAEDFESKEYVRLLVNIYDEGAYYDYFGDSFYDNKPWSHAVTLGYRTEAAQQFTKGRLAQITKSNPGFDAEAAWNGGDPKAFVGKKVGVVFRAEEYFSEKTGYVEMGAPRPDRLIPVSDVKACDVPKPKLIKDDDMLRNGWKRASEAEKESSTTSASGGGADAVEDIPFL